MVAAGYHVVKNGFVELGTCTVYHLLYLPQPLWGKVYPQMRHYPNYSSRQIEEVWVSTYNTVMCKYLIGALGTQRYYLYYRC